MFVEISMNGKIWKNKVLLHFSTIIHKEWPKSSNSIPGKVTYSSYFRGSLALSKCRPCFQFRFFGWCDDVDSVSLNTCRNNPNEAGTYQYLPNDILRVWIGVRTSTGISCFEVNASKIATGNHIWVNFIKFHPSLPNFCNAWPAWGCILSAQFTFICWWGGFGGSWSCTTTSAAAVPTRESKEGPGWHEVRRSCHLHKVSTNEGRKIKNTLLLFWKERNLPCQEQYKHSWLGKPRELLGNLESNQPFLVVGYMIDSPTQESRQVAELETLIS